MRASPPVSQPASPPAAARGPVRPGDRARVALRPVATARVTGGFWHERRRVNAEASVPLGRARLEAGGNLHNLRLAAGTASGAYRGGLTFLDSEVTKWLEAASWQLADPDAAPDADGNGDADVDEVIGLLARAQWDDGYLQSWYQVLAPEARFTELRVSHELYCAGHLIQAAVAHHRATGRGELLAVARRFADHIDAAFGPGRPLDGVCGHPGVETALVELYRETGERRYLDLAAYFLDRRGHGLTGPRPQGGAYCQDLVPVREARTVTGHAVRQLYLLAGATDVAAETGEPELRAAVERLWEAMTAAKTHLTGGLGAHHKREDFGDPYELPTERAYCETCAAVASIQWSWRLALLTGRARYSDLIERTLYNALLAGVSLDGRRWRYVNPLQVRDGYDEDAHAGDQSARLATWFSCACCPPNVMRLLASLPHYLASTDADGLQLHQYATGTFGGLAGGTPVAVRVETDYPWRGRITVTIDETDTATGAGAGAWTLSLRVPQWCRRHAVTPATWGRAAEDGWLRIRRAWRPGDTLVLDLDMEPRLTGADPRVDAVRGCVAVERGPLVHCTEAADQPDTPGLGLDDLVIDPDAELTTRHHPGLLGGVTTVAVSGLLRDRPAGPAWWPYHTVRPGHGGAATTATGMPVELTTIPYYAWGNRERGGIRVWLPTR